ncbi:MAG TPA: SH3 domain-containing protein [Propionibacteriaceae bacterium]|nr:SH3 domain-containing protein [Propionibacteriaceae bacterium]
MSFVTRSVKGAAAASALAIALQSFGGMLAGPMATADTQFSATTAVNVRTGPSTSHSIIGVLYQGNTVAARGASQNGWTPVTFQGKAGWVSSQYLTGTAATVPATATTAASTAVTIEALNVRSGPSLGSAVLTVLSKGTTVSLTGRTSNGFSEIGSGRWVSTSWITTATSTASGSRPLVGPTTQMRATAALMIRTTSDASFTNLGDVPSGTILETTGVVTNGVAQVLYQGQLRWVNANYLSQVGAAGPATNPGGLPAVVGTRYATAALDIRNTSADAYTAITEVPRGTALQITGTTENGRAQIIYSGAVRWVTAMYLSATAPAAAGDYSSGLSGLQPRAQAVVTDVRSRFPVIRTIYGVRADSIPDHPSGRAVDLMIPSYQSNAATGQQIAEYYRANASRFGIEYIIFNQRIWSVARSSEGWRYMADRGSDTANHKDHVHITVFN